jgi:hypothetical protein
MARASRGIAVAALVAGPTVLAFYSGGFFDLPRLVAAGVAWALVLLAAVGAERPLPRTAPARLALAGLALLTVWTAASLTWAPLSAPAVDDLQRLLLYLGALVAAIAFLRPRPTARVVELGLAAGALVVVGYGLAGRLLPGIVQLSSGVSAAGRLEQPLTYWNAMGALAAIGLILCTRIAGDSTRGVCLRAAGAAGAVPLGAGVYLSFSRGAILALVLGLVVLVLAARTREQLRSAALAVSGSILAAVATGAFDGVRSLAGPASDRDGEGALALALLLALAAAAAVVQARWGRRADASPDRALGTTAAPAGEPALGVAANQSTTNAAPRLGVPRIPPVVAVGIALVAVGTLIAAAAAENRANEPAPTGARTERLRSLQSNRLDYWRVALEGFAAHPIAGVGSAGFRAEWLRERTISEPAQDAHSLYLETLAELGLIGAAFLLMLLAGVAWCATRVLAADPALAAGPTAALAAFGLHAGLDWDWELPALSLVALVLAGLLCAQADRRADSEPA